VVSGDGEFNGGRGVAKLKRALEQEKNWAFKHFPNARRGSIADSLEASNLSPTI
jgi:hypothetical protein